MGRGFTIGQVPDTIRQELFYRRAFARRIGFLLDVLQKLKLVFKKVMLSFFLFITFYLYFPQDSEEELFYLSGSAGIVCKYISNITNIVILQKLRTLPILRK